MLEKEKTHQAKIEKVSKELALAWKTGGSMGPLSKDLWPTNLQEAYDIQDALDSKLEQDLAGWKIGMTSRKSMEAQGLNHPPMFGRLYKYITQNNPAQFQLSNFRNSPMLEGEFALRLGKDLPPSPKPYTIEEVRNSVEAVVMTIDAVDTRWGSHPFDLDIFQGNADNACAGAFVIGDDIPDWQNVDLSKLPVNLYLDGKLATGEPWPREQRCDYEEMVKALHWAANELSRRRLGFRKGQIVSTGSPHEPIACLTGAEVIIQYGNIGEIKATFVD